jgi:peptidoglycan/xylan/chitin deacetylase (PgdA/CDA1 family)
LQSSEPSKKTAVITIDDGYKSFYHNALPVLKKFNVLATLFINTETIGGDYMTWDELRDVVNSNFEIGNHTHSHKYFLDLPESSRYRIFKDEIELSQSIIKKKLNIEPKVFSFPFGELDFKMKNIVMQAGFVVAAAQNSGVLSEGTDLFQCPRFPMSESYSSKEQFIEKVNACGSDPGSNAGRLHNKK